MEHHFPGDAADRLLGNKQWASTLLSPQTGGLGGQGLFNHHVSPEYHLAQGRFSANPHRR